MLWLFTYTSHFLPVKLIYDIHKSSVFFRVHLPWFSVASYCRRSNTWKPTHTCAYPCISFGIRTIAEHTYMYAHYYTPVPNITRRLCLHTYLFSSNLTAVLRACCFSVLCASLLRIIILFQFSSLFHSFFSVSGIHMIHNNCICIWPPYAPIVGVTPYM